MVEAAKLILHLEERLGIFSGCFNLEAVADDASIAQQFLMFSRVVASDHLEVKLIKGHPKVVAFTQNRDPT